MRWCATLSACAALWCVPTFAGAEAGAGQALFQRGVELFTTEEYEAALDAFLQAYEQEPSDAILYNVAMCQMALLRYVESIETFNRYLGLVGDGISNVRRQEIADSIAEMEARLGELRLTIEPTHGDVEVILDDEPVPVHQWSGLRVRAGRHSIRVTAPRYLEEIRQVDIPSGSVTDVLIALQPDPTFVERTPVVRQWWFWTIIGTVVVGAATGLAVGLTSQNEDLGDGDWEARLP